MNAHDTACSPTAPAPVDAVLAHNRAFAAAGAAGPRPTTGRPARGLAIVTCMDARLTRLLPAALGLADGDAALIQVAGATIVDPYGEAMRSLLVAVGELGVRDIMVIGHTDCGTCGMHADHLAHALVEAGVPAEQIARERAARPELDRVLTGFANLADEVASSVRTIRTHPLMPVGVHVTGYTIDIETGALTPVAA